MHVDNDRWRGVPFLFRAGKGLDERLAEVRVTFKKQSYNELVAGPANELVMRIQPDEAIYMKVLNKVPGWDKGNAGSVVMDLSYKDSFSDSYVADAYERMFLNAARGEQALFVGDKELVEAWRIFTPLLHEIDTTKPKPVLYPFGSRVPPGMDEFAERYGITMSVNFEEFLERAGKKPAMLRKCFDELDKDKSGKLNAKEMSTFVQMFYDGRHPPENMVARVISRIDIDGDGLIGFDEILENIHHLQSWCVCPTKLDHSIGH
jgi:glucose-6-phosphate 1-dehydrogenase